MALIGYGRVSGKSQNPAHQEDALKAAGCERMFIDTASGKLASRPELDKCRAFLRPGDTLVITRLDRLGRSLSHLIELVAELGAAGIDLKVTEQSIDTTSPGGRLVFHMIAAVAEFQRELIVENTRDGLESARARGRVGGRKPKMTQTQIQLARRMYDAKGHTVQEIADVFGVGRATIYRHLGKGAPAGADTQEVTA